MCRHIKLRGWDLDYKVMDNHFYLHSSGIPYETPDKVYDTPNIEIEESLDIIVMQFTGLLDKNGEEIYEGDVVKCRTNFTINPVFKAETKRFIGTVGYDNYVGSFVVNGVKQYKGGSQTIHKCRSGIEVIGNIYENPELLEEEGL